MKDKLTISVSELAVQLGISKPKAYALAKSNGFPSINIGKRIVIPTEQLSEWLKENSKGIS